jgi:DNA ligase 1
MKYFVELNKSTHKEKRVVKRKTGKMFMQTFDVGRVETSPFQTLYKKTSLGQVQQWEIVPTETGYYTKEGIKDGKITKSKETKVEQKNIGKKNETSLRQQIINECKSKIQKKKDSGYVENIMHIDNKKFESPMLAKKYDDYTKKNNLWDGRKVFTQPKLDGIRCDASIKGMVSRNGKPFFSLPHISRALAKVFKRYPEIHFDGELYNHEYKSDFNKIVSLVTKGRGKVNDIKESDIRNAEKYIQYHIYDIRGDRVSDKIFSERNKILQDIVSAHGIVIVPTYQVEDQKALDKQYKKFLEDGYEGQMVRLNEKYHNKRCNSLLKRKTFLDKEFKIIDILEGKGNRSGMMGMLMLTDGKNTFKAGSRGNDAFRKEILKNKLKYIGLNATIRYQDLTPDKESGGGKVPRFGVMTKLRDRHNEEIPINI